MAKTNRERQADYRARRVTAGPRSDGDKRLNIWITSEAMYSLKRIAAHDDSTQRSVIERLLLAEDKRISEGMTDDEFETYLARTKALRNNE